MALHHASDRPLTRRFVAVTVAVSALLAACGHEEPPASVAQRQEVHLVMRWDGSIEIEGKPVDLQEMEQALGALTPQHLVRYYCETRDGISPRAFGVFLQMSGKRRFLAQQFTDDSFQYFIDPHGRPRRNRD